MTVFAFVDGSSRDTSVIEHAAWAAKATGEPITVVVEESIDEPDPAYAFDAYQDMDPRGDMYRELALRPSADYSQHDDAAIQIGQAVARKAKSLGVGHVRTVTTSESPAYFVENYTDSDDLLVVARGPHEAEPSRKRLDQFLKAQNRVMLLVPESYSPVESWLIAMDGKPAIGRAVDFLSRGQLLSDKPGTAVIVGNDYQSRIHFRDALRHLRSSNHVITSHELEGNAEDVLAAVLTLSPVDMLVMGAYGQGRFRLLNERSTTSRLLKTFRGPVLVAKA